MKLDLAITESNWKLIFRQNFTTLNQLTNFLEIAAQDIDQLLPKPNFAINVPLRLAQKMKKGDILDPIFRQFVPLVKELEKSAGFMLDPVGDKLALKEKKLLHKYHGRALLLVTSACAMHCRYCFRQNFPYETVTKGFTEELKLIAQDSTISEIILSGGDPLSLDDKYLSKLLNDLSEITHVKRVRFHSRFIVGIPQRIDDNFLEMVANFKFQFYFVLHINHPQELDAELFDKIRVLQKRGFVVMNQAVLLKGVNDDLEVQKELCEQLINHGVLPYYLSQLDKVQGAAHFEVTEEIGAALIGSLRSYLPGYGVPRYIKEEPLKPSKTVIC